jgi:[acyl-carrier-protein] S-malonyltransferase
MGSDIYDKYPSAKHVVDTCNTLLEFRLKDIMFKGPAGVLTSTKHAQPAIVCHSIALLRVLEQELGFKVEKCQVALGHSLGEYSALVATKSLK